MTGIGSTRRGRSKVAPAADTERRRAVPPRAGRLLTAVAALLAVSVVATGCDSSPFAASIDGQTVKQTALNAELRQLAGNPYYVKLAAQGVVSVPVRVAGTGTGSYNAAWSAGILSQMIVVTAVHQHLERTHRRPGPGQYAATRAVDSVLYGPGAWGAFSASFRATLVGQDADLAMVEPDIISAAQIQNAQAAYATQLFSDVCVRTVAVGVNGPDGSVDFPASLARARTVAAAIEAAPSAAAAGQVTCYTAAQLETQPLSFVLSVLDLRTGAAAAPQKTADGYTVTAVTSRAVVPADRALELAFSVAVNQNRGVTAQTVAGLIGPVKVKVNPAYGVWQRDAHGGYGIVPPAAPASGAAT